MGGEADLKVFPPALLAPSPVAVTPPSKLRRTKKFAAQLTGGRAWQLRGLGKVGERDMEVLKAVSQFELMTADQIRRLIFYKHASLVTAQNVMRRRLRVLYNEYCLNRWYFSLKADAVYRLDVQGARLLEINPRQLKDESALLRLMAHTLGITEFAVSLTEAARGKGGKLDWAGETQLALKVSREDYFEPDAAGVLRLPERNPVTFFLEWDRATERQGINVFIGKMRRYRNYHLTRDWQGKLREIFPDTKNPAWPPMVVVTTGGQNRLASIIKAVVMYYKSLKISPDDQPVYVTTEDFLQCRGILGDVFFQPGKVTKEEVIWEKGRSLADV